MSDWRQCLSVDINLRKLMTFDASTIICTKGICSKLRVHQYPRLIPSMDPWVTFDRYLIDTWLTPWLTLNTPLINILVLSQLILTDMPLSVDQHTSWSTLTNYWPTVNQLLIRCQLRKWLIVDSVLAKHPLRCWLRVSQGYQSQKPSVAKTFHSLALISLSL